MDKPIEKAISKIYDQISETGEVSENQLLFIMYYEKKRKKDNAELLKAYSKEILSFIDKLFPEIK